MKTQTTLILAALAWLTVRPCLATDRTWTGSGTDNHWTTAANWSGGVAPVAGDNLAFLWTQTSRSNYNDYPDGTVFSQIDVDGGTPGALSGYTFGGNRVVLYNGIATSGSVLYPNTTAKVDFNVTLGGDQTFSAARPLTFNGVLDINGYQLTLDNSRHQPGDHQLAGHRHGAGQRLGLLLLQRLECSVIPATILSRPVAMIVADEILN